MQGDCATRAFIDGGATAVGKEVGKGPMQTSKSFNAFNRYFGLVIGTKKAWIQVGPAGPDSCKVLAGAWDTAAITVGTKAPPRWEQIMGLEGVLFKQIAVSNAKLVLALDGTGAHWKWTGSSWSTQGCCVGTISAAADGTLWATHPANSNRVLRWTGTSWSESFPAGMKQVAAVNSSTVWGLDDTGSHFTLSGGAWTKKGCCVTQISASADGQLWATHPPNNNRVLRWNGSGWDESPPAGMVFVTVGSAQNVWGLNAAADVFKLVGNAWQKQPGGLHHMSAASDGSVWGVNTQGGIVRWVP